MKFRGVTVELVQMNHRRFVVGRDRHVPFASECSAHVGFDLVQRFLRWRFVKSNRDAVLDDIQPYLLHIWVRFDQSNHLRPSARSSLRGLHVWDDFVRHL